MKSVIQAGICIGSCLFFLFVSFNALAQTETEWALVLNGSVISQNDKTKLVGAKVVVYKNGARSDQSMTDAKGKFSLRLPPDAKYMLEFSYVGYSTKRISFNTKMVPPEASAGGDFLFPFDMTLFKEMEGLDVSILSKPLAEVAFDPNLQDFSYNKEYTKSVQAQIEKLQSDLEAKLLAESEALKEVEKQYQKSMADGAKAMAAGDYMGAKTAYAAALAVKAGDVAAQSKLDDAQKKYEKDTAEKQGEKAYKEAIEKAELALHQDNLKGAEVEFQKALDAKPGDIYARDQLKEVRDKMVAGAKAEQTYIAAIGKADAALAVKDYITAKAEYGKAVAAKPGDKYATGQLAQVDQMLAADARKESEYMKAIERAEVAMEGKDYESARAAFEQASSIKPEEKYPKDQLAKIDGLLAEIQLQAKKYQDAVKRGDAAFAAKDYPTAKTAYEEAIALNPSQQYPKDQVAAITKKIAEQAQLETQYADLMKDAELRFQSKDYIAAKAQYVKALEIKPAEALPKNRITEISAILEKEARLEASYKSAIANADNAFNAKDYNSAKFEYETASKLKPDEAYPKAQLGKIAGFLAEQAKKEEAYTKAVAEGDANMKAGSYDKAKAGYQAASLLKPDEKYPKDQIAAIDAKLIELASLKKQYDESILAADKLFESGKLEEARAGYEKALSVQPSEQYPRDRIASITASLADAKKKDEEYAALISKADDAFSKKDYNTAKTTYNTASSLKPGEKYPKDKILEINALEAAMAENQKQYNAAIAAADAAFKANKLQEALPLYEKAAGLKETETYPVSQITLIENKLGELKKKDESYAASIAKAEAAEKGGDIAGAITEFKTASSIKPEEAYPKQKIESLGAQLAASQKMDADYKQAITLAEQAKLGKEYDIAIAQFSKASSIKPAEQYPKDQLKEVEALKAEAMATIAIAKKQDDDYKALVSEADAMFSGQKYDESRKKYQAALNLKPTEEHPKSRIAEIDRILASQMAEKERKDKYAAMIAAGDKAFNAKDWQTAKGSFQEAAALQPSEAYPPARLKAIEDAIAQEAAMASQKEKDDKYNALIGTADKAFNSKDWESARNSYRQAAAVKPEETYPAKQLTAIEAAIAADAALAEKAEKDAAEKEKNLKYTNLISAGDKAFVAKNWEGARQSFREAGALKPAETYPPDRLKAIDAAIAEAAALASKQEKEAAAKELDAKYLAAITNADKAFKVRDWENSRSAYKEAMALKPAETYPAQQIKAIDDAIASEASQMAQKEKDAASKAREEKYKFHITAADQAFRAKDWEEARSSYREASSVKPEESYPGEQLKAIDKAIAEESALAKQMEQDALEKQKNEKYTSLIAAADKSFTASQWASAKSSYQEALKIKPTETYPRERLADIELKIQAGAEGEKRKQYDAFIATADRAFKAKDWSSSKMNYESALGIIPAEVYPSEQLKRIEEAIAKEKEIALKSGQDESYRQALGDADQLFAGGDWSASKAKYEEALSIKPSEVYPKNRIAEINGKLSAEADAAARGADYQKLIAQGDAAFAGADYEGAKLAYNSAIAVKNDAYPKGKLKEIEAILAKQKAADLAGKQAEADKLRKYNSLIAEGDRNFSSKNYTPAKNSYQAALAIQPAENYPKGKLKEIEDILSSQSGPVSQQMAGRSSGMSEAEIAAMMAKWQQERESSKADRMNQYKTELEEASAERTNNADERRMASGDELAELETQIETSNKAGIDKNLEEARIIEEFRQDIVKQENSRTEVSEEARNGTYDDIRENEEGQKEMMEKGNELYKVHTELVTTQKIELIEQDKEMSESAHQGVIQTHADLVEHEKSIDESRESRGDQHMKDVDRIKKDNELVLSSIRTWADESHESRSETYNELVALEKDIVDYQVEMSTSYQPNTEKYNLEVEEMNEYHRNKAKEAKTRRNKAYQDIEDYTAEVGQLTEERHNRYEENNRSIQSRNTAILDEQARLTAEADERRMRFDGDFYSGEKKPRLPEEAARHTNGVTEESYEQGDSYIIKRTVVNENGINEYEKIFFKWGGVYYKKNGVDITDVIWNSETK